MSEDDVKELSAIQVMVGSDDDDIPDVKPTEIELAYKKITGLGSELGFDDRKWAILMILVTQIHSQRMDMAFEAQAMPVTQEDKESLN